MAASDFLVGWAFLVLWFGGPALVAVLIRRRLLPGWSGAPALLVDAVSTLALVLTAAQLVGTVGGLTRPGLSAATTLVAAAGALLSRRLPAGPRADLERASEPLWSRGVAVVAASAVLGVWAVTAEGILRIGTFGTDSLVYHWPYAATFAQTGWTTRIQLGAPGFGSSWHAADGELLDGITILAFHRDWLLPLLNVGWLGLLLLAAVVSGRRWGLGGVAVAVVCVPLAVPVLARSQPGSGFTDTASLALLFAAVALLLEAWDSGFAPRVLLWSGAAAGLAASTKETTLAVVAATAVAVLVLCLRSGRWPAFLLWAAPAAVLGSFWYVRNLVREGNPIPTSDLGPWRSVGGPLLERYGFSVAHFLGDGTVIRTVFVPGLWGAWGLLWPVLVAAPLLAIGLTARRGTPAQLRAVAVVGGVGLLAYLVTPTTAYGFHDHPVLFGQNTRYALPAVLVLLVLLVRVVGAGRGSWVLGAGALLVLSVTVATRHGTLPSVPRHKGFEALRDALVALVLIAGCWGLRTHVTGRGRRWVAAAAVVLVLPVLFVVGRDYERDRYPASAGDASRTFAWASTVHHVRIGVDGLLQEYPLTGNDVSNQVSYLGVRNAQRVFSEAPSCQVWRSAVNASDDDYVVIGPDLGGGPVPPAAGWVDRNAMQEVLSAGAFHTYRVTGPLNPATCP